MQEYVDIDGLRTFKNKLEENFSTQSLTDYTASDTSIAIDDNKIAVNISVDSDNMLVNTANGLYVDGSGKTDKVNYAVENNFAVFDSDGGILDSGYKVADDSNVLSILDEKLHLNPLQIIFTAPEELNDSDTLIKRMLDLNDTATITSVTPLGNNIYDGAIRLTYKVNSSFTKVLDFISQRSRLFLFNELYFELNRLEDEEFITLRSIDDMGPRSILLNNISVVDYLNCLTTGKFLKFLAMLLQALLENYVNISYDEDTNSIILTATNGYITRIYIKLEDFIGLQNDYPEQISDGVKLIEKISFPQYSYFDLVFEKTK